jgi:Flp pilus assembly CpaE family ATPase
VSAEPRRVVLAAAGAGWEPSAVRALEAARDVVLVRRCVDVAELIAVAQAGAATVAAVDLSVPGLDVEAVSAVRAAGVRLVGLGPQDRAAALGVDVVGTDADVLDLVRSVPGDASPSAPTAADASLSSTGDDLAPLVAVWGPAGAPGRSTVALALADAVGAPDKPAVLVDADTYGGAQAQLLGLLDEVSGVMAACRVANQGREEDVDEHLQVVREGLAVLTGLPRPEMWVHVRRAALRRVLDRVRRTHATVVADVGFCLEVGDGPAGSRNQATLTVLEEADVVVVVGRADPVGLTRLVRGLHDLREHGVGEPLVVLDQVRDGIGWSADELASTVHRLAGVRPLLTLPHDPATLDTAALRGATPREVDPRAPFVVAVDALAALALRVRPVASTSGPARA